MGGRGALACARMYATGVEEDVEEVWDDGGGEDDCSTSTYSPSAGLVTPLQFRLQQAWLRSCCSLPKSDWRARST
jgi:hypothetical protein